MPDQSDEASEVLAFWFTKTMPQQWFAKDPAFDNLVQQRFLSLIRRAIAPELEARGVDETGGLALATEGGGGCRSTAVFSGASSILLSVLDYSCADLALAQPCNVGRLID